ncbi:uncharacterized protein LOC142234634 [Haematobia irritans]|uniref:uncharacterized protein LOC142234634 n=1 Tax=Haematobia irritans TaxID=7368 RepID=UPI003F4FB0FD
METPHNSATKEFEVTGISRSGRVRKKSSKLLDFLQSPDESSQRKVYKRSNNSGNLSRNPVKHGRGRPSLAALKARQEAVDDEHDVVADDDDLDSEHDVGEDREFDTEMDIQPINSDEDDETLDDDDLGHNPRDETDDDGFGELVADLVGVEGSDKNANNPDSKVRKSLYMTEKRMGSSGGRLERKDKGKCRYTAYSLWAREYRKTANFGKEVDFQTARRELWANVSNKEKNNWRRKAKIQATKAKALERAGGANKDGRRGMATSTASTNSTFINRPTTSRTKKLQMQAEEKQKAMEDMTETKSQTKRTRNNSHNRKSTTAAGLNKSTNAVTLYTNGPTSNSAVYNINTPLPTIEPIDAAAHLKLLGESLTIIGERLKDHEGQIAVSGSLSVLLDTLLCSLGPLLCLTTCLPGMDKKSKLKTNLAITLDNIAYVMPGL